MKVIVVFKRLLASGNDQHGRHLFKWGNRWNILGFNFTKRDALSSVYKISMNITHYLCQSTSIHKSGPSSPSRAYFVFDQLTNIATSRCFRKVTYLHVTRTVG